MISLVIVDDHPIVRDGLRSLFDADPRFEVIGEAADGGTAIGVVQRLRPDVVLMDLRMPGGGGARAIAELAQRGVPSRVLVLTTYDTDADVLPAIEAGASGYLLKDTPKEELFGAVEEVAQGRSVLAPAVASKLMGSMRRSTNEVLSRREREVLELVAEGSSNRQAAERLFVSEATVKTHLLHIYAKLGVNDRAAAVAVGFSRGYLLPRE
ncbi:response regulator transcription factor [uncultured Agrococcus sp.]|uniref:response regulator n=1 Tax=uncultured Agrococcus sp. TaxID=382258 RepID=UPI002600E047|nr:response regulator transcription factor [uncultured Agrococcus sp.]